MLDSGSAGPGHLVRSHRAVSKRSDLRPVAVGGAHNQQGKEKGPIWSSSNPVSAAPPLEAGRPSLSTKTTMSNITDKILCTGLRTSCLGTTAQDQEATQLVLDHTGAKRGKIRATKTILGDVVTPFRKLRSDARRYFNSMTLPGLSEDLRIIPAARLAELQTRIAEYQEKDASLLVTLKANYAAAIEKDRVDLGDAFDPRLYPDKENLHQFFRISLQVCDMPAGDYARVHGLTAAARQQMQEEHQKMIADVGRNASNEVFRRMTELVAHIAEKMSDPDAKKFHDSTFSNLTEYLEMVPDLNITNDPLLENLRREAKEKLSYSMRVVKESAFLKEQAATAAKDILSRFGAIGTGRKLVA